MKEKKTKANKKTDVVGENADQLFQRASLGLVPATIKSLQHGLVGRGIRHWLAPFLMK